MHGTHIHALCGQTLHPMPVTAHNTDFQARWHAYNLSSALEAEAEQWQL